MDCQRQAAPGLSADGPDGRTRLGLRLHRLLQEPAQRVARPPRRRQARAGLGSREHRRLRRRSRLHRGHGRLSWRPPGLVGRAHRQRPATAARLRGRRHDCPSRGALLRRLRPDRSHQNARDDDAVPRAFRDERAVRRQSRALRTGFADFACPPRCPAIFRAARRKRFGNPECAGTGLLRGASRGWRCRPSAMPNCPMRTTLSTCSPR